LLAKMIKYCAQRGTRAMVGRVRSENHAMLKMAQELGFRRRPFPDPGEAEVELDLDAVRAAAIS
jgi:acetyltransferase